MGAGSKEKNQSLKAGVLGPEEVLPREEESWQYCSGARSVSPLCDILTEFLMLANA